MGTNERLVSLNSLIIPRVNMIIFNVFLVTSAKETNLYEQLQRANATLSLRFVNNPSSL